MDSTQKILPVVVLATLLPGIPVRAQDAPVTDRAALESRIESLEADVQRLRTAAPGGDTMSTQRAEAIRTIVEDVLADADTRSSLLDDDIQAGWDDGFVLRDADGRYELELSGQVQVRAIYNERDDPDPGEDSTQFGVENRRTKIKLDGYVFDPRIHYTIKVAFEDDTGTAVIQDVNLEYSTGDWKWRVGVFRSPLLREEFVSSKRQLAVERSLISKTFRQDRTTGVSAIYEGDAAKLSIAVMDASGDGALGGRAWLGAARADIVLDGSKKSLKDLTSLPGADPVTAVGLGVLYQDNGDTAPTEPGLERLRWTVDVTIEREGWHVFAALIGDHTETMSGMQFDRYGVVVQGGVFVTDDTELFAMYQWGDADGVAEDLSLVTVGANRYLHEHELKLTIDASYGIDEIGEFWDSSGAGFDEDAIGQDGQFLLRAQLQLLF